MEEKELNFSKPDLPVVKNTLLNKLMTIGVMLFALAGLVILGYLAYKEGKSGVDEDFVIPIIQANNEPFKIKPEYKGGEEIPNQDIKVYDFISDPKKVGGNEVEKNSTVEVAKNTISSEKIESKEEAIKKFLEQKKSAEIESNLNNNLEVIKSDVVKTEPVEKVKNKPDVKYIDKNSQDKLAILISDSGIEEELINKIKREKIAKARFQKKKIEQEKQAQENLVVKNFEPVVKEVVKEESLKEITRKRFVLKKPSLIQGNKQENLEPINVVVKKEILPIKDPAQKPDLLNEQKSKNVRVITFESVPTKPSFGFLVSKPIQIIESRSGTKAGKGIFVQLGSFKSIKPLNQSWKNLKKRFPILLNDMKYKTQAADLGDRGFFYRLQTGPFSTRKEALGFCSVLIKKKQDCIIVK